MPVIQQIFSNRTAQAFYIYVEPNPDCYKLQPGDSLTVVESVPDGCNPGSIKFLNEESATIWPANCIQQNVEVDEVPEPKILLNDQPADDFNWNWN